MYISIKKRLSLTMIIVILFFLILGIGVIFSNSSMTSITSKIQSLQNTTVLLKDRFIDHLFWMNQLLESIVTEENFTGQTDPTKCAFGKWYYAHKGTKEYEKLSLEQKQYFDKMEEFHNKLHQSAIEINSEQGMLDRLEIYTGQTKKNVDNLQKLFKSYVDKNDNIVLSQETRSKKISKNINYTIILTTLIIIIFTSIITVLIIRKIVGSINKVQESVFHLSRGELHRAIVTKKVDCSKIMKCGKVECPEYDRLTEDCFISVGSYAPEMKNEIHCPSILNGKHKTCLECKVMRMVINDEMDFLIVVVEHFRKKLLEIMKKMMSMITSITTSSTEIAAASENLSSGTNDQAANIEEISASLEEIGSLMSQNADNSKSTNKIAVDTTDNAVSGEKSVGETIEAMNGIAENINSIVSIASRTNLLALNAGIEAARAGAHGKGFAVVANEVRELAVKSQHVSKDISELAERSVSVSNKAGENLKEIVVDIKRTADLISEITNAIEEQDQGLTQVNSSMSQINEITQQNAASSEELASVATNLSHQAIELQEDMSFFTIEDDSKEGNKDKDKS